MTPLTKRNIEILRIIVTEYIENGKVLGSKMLLKKYDLGVSPATVRSDMAKLEELELVYQPYNSAGRLPTTKGIRAYVNFMMENIPEYFLPEKGVQIGENNWTSFNDYAHHITYELAKNTGEIAFFSIPDKHFSEHTGIATFLRRNRERLGDDIYSLIAMLEDKVNFLKFISSYNARAGVNLYIGEENFLPYLKDYTIIIKPIMIDGHKGYIGIIGSLKMDYSFNMSAVKGIL